MNKLFDVHEQVRIEEPKFSEAIALSLDDLVFFTHAIIIQMVGDQRIDLLSQIAKEQNIKIYAHKTKKYISSKKVRPPFDSIVFACHKNDWDFFQFLTTTVDYYEDDVFYRLFWKAFPTKTLPEPLNKKDQFWVLGLQASIEHSVPSYIPHLDDKWIIFEKTDSFVISPVDAGVSALLTVYEDDLRAVTKEWSALYGDPSRQDNIPKRDGYEKGNLLHDTEQIT